MVEPIPPPIHIKLTQHFLRACQSRELSRFDLVNLWSSFTDGRFLATVDAIPPGLRGAICIGQSYVVASLDGVDGRVAACLTLLDQNAAQCLARRDDTVLMTMREPTQSIAQGR